MKKKHYIAIASVVFLLIFIIGVLPGLSILHGEMDIDLHSGKCRLRYYVWKIKIDDRVVETKLSKLISETLHTETEPLWKSETKRSDFPLRYRQGGRYKSSCDDFVDRLELGEELGKIDQDQKVRLIQEFMMSMKEKDVKRMEEICEEVAILYQESFYPQQSETDQDHQ